jgi:hypothetical protein
MQQSSRDLLRRLDFPVLANRRAVSVLEVPSVADIDVDAQVAAIAYRFAESAVDKAVAVIIDQTATNGFLRPGNQRRGG